jgi:hypothetical protein
MLKKTTIVDVYTVISSVTDNSFANGATYNISGQRVGEQTEGVIIQNGKKFFNR